MRNLILMVVVATLTTSCSIDQQYKFNEDYSGTVSFTINMSEFMTKMKKTPTDEDKAKGNPLFGQSNENLDDKNLFEHLDGIEGITNVKDIINHDEMVYGVGVDFKDLQTLNTFFNESDYYNNVKKDEDAVKATNVYFEESKGWLIIKDKGMDAKRDKETEKMFESMKYHLNYSFAKPISKVKSNLDYTLSDDKKTLDYSGPMLDALAAKGGVLFKVKF